MRNSNTSREGRPKLRGSLKRLFAVLAFVCFANPANAFGSNGGTSRYVRDQWSAEQGFPGGAVHAIAQTPDGYLWIGAEKGLFRFDGFNFHLIQATDSTVFPVGPVLGLAVDADGNLWVRQLGTKVLKYRDGAFQDGLAAVNAQDDVTAMSVGTSGDILISGFVSGISRYSQGKFVTLASKADLPHLIISMAETADGKVWMGTREAGLFCLSDGRVSSITRGIPDKKINSLLAADSDELWIGTDNGVVHWNGTQVSEAGQSHALDRVHAFVTIRDRDSNVWVGTSTGLIRIDARGVSSLERDVNRSSGFVTSLFEDRERNLWVGTTQGIERLRASVFTTYSLPGTQPSENNGPVHVDSEGRAWFAPSAGGLYWIKEGHVGRVANAELDRDVTYSLSGGKGEIWIGRRGGLTHLQYTDNSFTTKTYTQANGLTQNSVYAVHQNRDGSVWAGTVSGGLSWFRNGQFKTFTTSNGLGSNSIASILESSDGTMWFGTPNGLSEFSKGQWRIYTSRDGLPPGTVNCLLEDSAGGLWIGTANGLAFLSSGAIQPAGELPESLREQILGIEEDRIGSLWIATANHILRVDREKMLRHALGDADVREFGLVDGLGSTQGVKRHKSVAADSQGQIWFSTNGGISFINPTRAMASSVPAIVHVEEVSADGRRFNIGEKVRVPAPHQRITLSYSGLSLSVPARVRFKYMLEGFDPNWSEPTAARQAVYTNLSPSSYRFRVVASNSEGTWNGLETALVLEVAPALWQTWWFRLSIVLAIGLVILLFFRLRVLSLTRQMNMRFEERLAERTRIAQELHDTLLQGFLSASMQLHIADEHLSADSPAKPFVGRVLKLMGQVIEEGRDALRGLRSSNMNSPDLEQAFSQIREEFPMHSQIGFRVIVEGTPRPLRTIIRDEIYQIGHEALSNAFRHARASDIEVELEYAPSHLRVLVRDDGSGIDTQVLRSGREGHWGLSGMKERTEKIGGKLRVLSRAVAGTEVELSVPGKIAFEFRSGNPFGRWISSFYGGNKRND